MLAVDTLCVTADGQTDISPNQTKAGFTNDAFSRGVSDERQIMSGNALPSIGEFPPLPTTTLPSYEEVIMDTWITK